MDLRDATVLLTGATGGIGHAIARAAAREGAKLILTGRRTEVLEPLAQETGGRAVACDLADRAALDAFLDELEPIDVLIANAALPASGPLEDYTQEEIDRALDVNLRAPIVLAKRLAPPMVERGRGHLVFISSLAGKSAAANSSLYSATKFGVRGFSLGLREDLHPHGVGVSTVFPGFIRDAGMFADAEVKLPRGVGTSSPEEVADGVLAAITKNKAEVDVAPLPMRVGAKFASVAPGISAAVQRRLGASEIGGSLAEGQRSKR
jgi:short-subunit dehydrogenase